MIKSILAAPLLLAAFAATPAAAAPHTLDPNAFAAFVVNWRPESVPLCAALRSGEEWSAVLHPAAVMGGTKAFGPDRQFWGHHAVLLFARVVPSGDVSHVFAVDSVHTERGTITVALRSTPPAPATSTMKAWTGVVVVQPIPDKVRFVENGVQACAVDLRRGYVSPALEK